MIGTAIRDLTVSTYVVPTSLPEADGTFAWDRTTVVVVQARAGGVEGLGYTYADASTATLISQTLQPVVEGLDVFAIPAAWEQMRGAIRNLGRGGIASMAIAAVDTCLWDLKAKLLGVSLVSLLGASRRAIDAYGSGGFTSYSMPELVSQLSGWVEEGMSRVKMKVGKGAGEDARRIFAVREALGQGPELLIDANGAYRPSQALELAQAVADQGVIWFEEPTSSDDLRGMAWVRSRIGPGIDVAAGEYGYDLPYFARMLESGAVDVLQVDATRCGGITEAVRAGALCAAQSVPLSAHTAPTLHAHLCCALAPAIHVEYFHDHARIEQMLFDGALVPHRGQLRPDFSRPGLGIELKVADARRFAA